MLWVACFLTRFGCDCVASLLFSLGVCMLRVFAVGCVGRGVVAVGIVAF